MTAGVTVLNLMVHRFRRAYIAFPIYLLFLIVVAHLPASWIPPAVLGLLCMPFAIGLLATVFGFVNAEADIASANSAYSPWLLRLPLKTSTLALWPIAASTAWATASWVIFATCYLRPRGVEAGVWWPAATIVALALNLQAILWPPVRRGALRMLLAITMPTAIALFGVIAIDSQWSAEKVITVYVVVSVVSGVAGYLGLAKARTAPSHRLQKTAASDAQAGRAEVRNTQKPFRSPQAAQFWLEWRRQGRLLPILTGLWLLIASLPLIWSHDTDRYLGSEVKRLNIWVAILLPYLPFIPLVLATLIGLGARPSDVRGTDGVYHLYHATRPLSANSMYKAKMASIFAGVLLAAAITIGTMSFWIFLPFALNNGERASYASLIGAIDSRGWTMLSVEAIVLIAWMWRNQAVGAFVDYLPSGKLAKAYPAAVMFLFSLGFAFVGVNGGSLQDPRSLLSVSVLLGIALVLKLGTAIWSAAKLISLRPSEARGLFLAFGRWAAVSAVVASAVGWIVYSVPKEAIHPSLQHPVPELLAFILVPLARPSVARIALELGRHR